MDVMVGGPRNNLTTRSRYPVITRMRSTGPKLTEVLLTRTEKSLRDLLENEAASRGVTVAFLIREALNQFYGPRLLAHAEVTALMGSQIPYVTPEEES